MKQTTTLRWRFFALPIFGVVVVGCGAAEGNNPGASPTIVSAEKAYTFTVKTPTQAFEVPGAVLVLPSARIVVSDIGATQLHIFSARGDSDRLVGRKGNGPGEYQNLGTVFFFGRDTIGIWDASLRRVVLFNEYGDDLATIPFLEWRNNARLLVLGRLDDGRYIGLARQLTRASNRERVVRDSAFLVVGRLDEYPQYLGPLPSRSYMQMKVGARDELIQIPGGANPSLVMCSRGVVVVSDTETRTITIDSNGTSYASYPSATRARTLSAADRERELISAVFSIPNPAFRMDAIAKLKAVTPSILVFTGAPIFDTDGSAWSRDPSRSGIFVRVTPFGSVMTAATLPDTMSLLHASDTLLFATGFSVDGPNGQLTAYKVPKTDASRTTESFKDLGRCGATVRY